jgi:signal transduction histidine kinase
MSDRCLRARVAIQATFAVGLLYCSCAQALGTHARGSDCLYRQLPLGAAAGQPMQKAFPCVAVIFASEFLRSYGVYLGVIALLALASWAGFRWARQWRAGVLAQRDRDVFEMVDQWTKNLQQEVAERKQAQKALIESQQVAMRQERLAAVGQLAAGVAHEFNNILTVIQGHAALLLENPSLDQDSIKSLNHISSGVERTAKLIRQMLAFSRKQVMQQQTLELNDVIRNITEMLRPLVGENISLRVNLAPQPLMLLGDAGMIEQIIVNLAVNARDAMEKSGGQLSISTREVNLTAAGAQIRAERRAGRFVEISVADTGCGMDAKVMDHLFEPFFSTKDVGKGVGLGLATVYGMVNQHQGWIEVESQPGKGAVFTVYFPAMEQPRQVEVEQTLPVNVKGGSEMVLVVEDEVAVREVVCKVLKGHGYRVLEAGSGVEALQLWAQNSKTIDLLLTDIIMPEGISGLDLADKLLTENPRLRVIFSSGYSQDMLERKHEPRKGVTFLSKPYHPSQLAKVVRNCLDSPVRA